MRFREGQQLVGTPYRVRGLIGSGGMGSVYEVEHAELGRRFVLKVLHPHLMSRPDLVARMRNEWRALAKLNHPNIVQVTDAGQIKEGSPFYVMELLDGKNLAQVMLAQGPMDAHQAAPIIIDVLEALHAAHETGAIHRDVKPQNIFVSPSGDAKLLDFGIAKLRDRAARVVTAGGVSIGTPRYMAPEQAEGGEVDGRADIYAAALVLYEMLVGRGPYAHIRDANELVMAHIGEDAERADYVCSAVLPEWGDLLQRWLAKSPANRPGSAGMAADELRSLLEATPRGEARHHAEVTVAGVYEASTVGAVGSLEESASCSVGLAGEDAARARGAEYQSAAGDSCVGKQISSDEASRAEESAAEGSLGAVSPTLTHAHEAEANSEGAIASGRGASTRGFGTHEEALSHTVGFSPESRAANRAAGQRQLPKEQGGKELQTSPQRQWPKGAAKTPPPVSVSSFHGRALRAWTKGRNWNTLLSTGAAAGVSFLIAWFVMQQFAGEEKKMSAGEGSSSTEVSTASVLGASIGAPKPQEGREGSTEGRKVTQAELEPGVAEQEALDSTRAGINKGALGQADKELVEAEPLKAEERAGSAQPKTTGTPSRSSSSSSKSAVQQKAVNNRVQNSPRPTIKPKNPQLPSSGLW